jgi:hypothetical protein
MVGSYVWVVGYCCWMGIRGETVPTQLLTWMSHLDITFGIWSVCVLRKFFGCSITGALHPKSFNAYNDLNIT